jgi:hypothetical protein
MARKGMTAFETEVLDLLERIEGHLSDLSGDVGLAQHGTSPLRCVLVEPPPKPRPPR